MREKTAVSRIFIIILVLMISMDLLTFGNTAFSPETCAQIDESYIEQSHEDNVNVVICTIQNSPGSNLNKNIYFSQINISANTSIRSSIKVNVNRCFQLQKNHLQIARLKAG